MSEKRRKKLQNRAQKKKRNAMRKKAESIVLERLKKSEHLSNVEVVNNPPGAEKMSQVILDFAEPLTDELSDDDDVAFKNIIGLAISVWNISLLPDMEKEKALEQLSGFVPAYDDKDAVMLQHSIDFLMKRKKKFFSKNKRFIIDYQVTTSKHDRDFYVVSTPDRKQFKEKLTLRKAKKPWWQRILPG